MLAHTYVALLAALVAIGCGGGGDGGGPVSVDLKGVVQKGPFLMGTSIFVQDLTPTLAPAGNTHMTQTTDDLGSFALSADLSHGLVEVVATGYYFDEFMNANSSGEISLRAIADAASGATVNLNPLTTLEKKRLVKLVGDGLSFAAAKETVEREVLAAFGFTPADSHRHAQSLDVTQPGDENAMLLAVAVQLLCASGGDPAELTQLLANIEAELEGGGILGDGATKTALSSCGRLIDAGWIRANLEARLAELGVTVQVPPFEQFLDSDGDGVIDRDDPYSPGTMTQVPIATNHGDDCAAVALADGRVLVAGGLDPLAQPGELAAADLYDPVSQSFTATGSMLAARYQHTMALLPDGRVLVAGGGGWGAYVTTAEVWDPSTGAFVAAGSLAEARMRPRATALPDGRVLVAGGEGESGAMLSDAEIWDQSAGMFTKVVSLSGAPSLGGVIRLPDGRVFLYGHAGDMQGNIDFFDPTNDQVTPSALTPGTLTDGIPSLLPDGRIIIGKDGYSQVYDPSTDSIAEVFDGLLSPYAQIVATASLSDGRTLLVSPQRWDCPRSGRKCCDIELLDPATGLYSCATDAPGEYLTDLPVLPAAAAPLPGGGALLVGRTTTGSALLFSP